MDGFKLIKTTFENKKEIVGVHFSGEQSYYSFIEEGLFCGINKDNHNIINFIFTILVKDAYNIPKDYEIQVYSTDFVIKPKLFVPFVAQYINNLDFVLDIKIKNKPAASAEIPLPASVPKPQEMPIITVGF